MEAGTIPTILSNTPLNDATNVPTNAYISAVFSENMDEKTLTTDSFTLTAGAMSVAGTVTYANTTATFWPAFQLASDTTFVATISQATSAAGVDIESKHSWSFKTGTSTAPGIPVDLGTARNYVILSKSGISSVPNSTITGDLGVSPAAASYITGFSLTADATNAFSTSIQVNGRVYAADHAAPTPSNLTTAIGDMQLAFTSAAARAPDLTELNDGNIGGMTLLSGVYKWGTSVLIPTSITLDGNATDVWIFQIANDLNVSNGVNVTLAGGALPKNVFWQVSGAVSIGTTAHVEGIILSKTSIDLKSGASLNGRLLAQTAVTMSSNTVVQPAD